MARGEANLKSKSARDKLKPAGKPYYRLIDAGLYIGYRKGKTGGKWVARRYIGDEKYVVETIGTADDAQTADGATILDFSQAQTHIRDLAAASRGTVRSSGPLTVSGALDAYLGRLEDEGSKSVVDARSRIEKHIRPALGDVVVADLTRDQIAGWLKAASDRPRHVRGKKDQESRALAAPSTADERRRRKASANRTLTILRAALNQAFRDGNAASDVPWRTVKPFREVDAARVRYFTLDEARRLVNAAQGDFRALVQAALFTGCRYGELAAARAGDFNPDAGTLFIAQSKSGKARHVVLTGEGERFFAQLVAGRPANALLLAKADGSAWAASHQLRPMANALEAARIVGGSFHILRHTAASHNVMGGVPLAVVAQNLGHADTRMTEKHYAHLAPSYVAEQLRKFAPTLGPSRRQTSVPSDEPKAQVGDVIVGYAIRRAARAFDKAGKDLRAAFANGETRELIDLLRSDTDLLPADRDLLADLLAGRLARPPGRTTLTHTEKAKRRRAIKRYDLEMAKRPRPKSGLAAEMSAAEFGYSPEQMHRFLRTRALYTSKTREN